MVDERRGRAWGRSRRASSAGHRGIAFGASGGEKSRLGNPLITCALAALLSLGLGACGSTSGGDGSAGGSGADDGSATSAEVATYGSYVAAYARADCERELRCNSKTKHASVAACLAAINDEIKRQRKQIELSVTAGRTDYSATDASKCLAVVRGDCTKTFLDIALVCNEVITGKVALGEKCVGHFECAEPPGHKGLGPYCFEGCKGLFGKEDPVGDGICYLISPMKSAPCK